MTLSEIATFAGEKIGKTDSDTVTFLKKSASLNYRRVWNFAPWRETVTHSTYSVSTSTRTITLGSNVETPLAVAYGDDELAAIDLPTIIAQDADLLDTDRTGTPMAYYFKGRDTGGTSQIDLYPILNTTGTTTLKVVEKLKCLTRNNHVVDFPPSTDALDDELRLPHCHQVVLDLVHADALQRERQYEKAASVVNTANADLSAMASYELSQVGSVKQITPSGLGELLREEIE